MKLKSKIMEEIKDLNEDEKKSVYEYILFLTFKNKLIDLKKLINAFDVM